MVSDYRWMLNSARLTAKSLKSSALTREAIRRSYASLVRSRTLLASITLSRFFGSRLLAVTDQRRNRR